MTNSILLYLIQSEKEIPTQLVPNTAYYIIGKEVRIIDNLGQMSIFKMTGAARKRRFVRKNRRM